MGKTRCGTGGCYCCINNFGMAECLNNVGRGRKHCVTNGAINNAIVGAFTLTGGGNVVFSYGRLGAVT